MPARPFDELTVRGRTSRLRRLIPAVIAQHDIRVARVRLVAQAFNTTFRIDTVDGRRFALRVGSSWRLHTDAVSEVEAAWTKALAADTEVRPPQVVRTRSGAPSVWATSSGVPVPRECVLFTWQEGRPLRGRLGDAELVAAAGEVLATLHEHAAAFDGVRADQVLRADRVCYFRVPQVLSQRCGALFSDGLAWAQEGIDALWRTRGSRAMLLHGDAHPSNLLVRHHRVVPVDFQDAIWAPVEQDLAITLTSLDARDPSGAHAATFRDGYRRRRRWPEIDPDLFDRLQIARRLHVANLMLHVWPSRAPTYVAMLDADLRRRLRTTA